MITDDFVISHRTVFYLSQRMVGRMAGDAVCAVAQPTIAEWPVGKLRGPTGEPIPYDGPLDYSAYMLRAYEPEMQVPACELAPWQSPGGLLAMDSETTAGGELGRSKILTLTEALDVGGLTWASYAQRALQRLRTLGTYRGFLSYRVFQRIASRNLARYSAECGLHIMGRYRPIQGPRYISTRNRKWVNQEDGTHCGRSAKHHHAGRPALSAAEAMRRQQEHNAKRRKTRRPYVMVKRKPYKPKDTKFGRPMRASDIRRPVIKPEAKEMPPWLRRWAVKKGIDRMGLTDRSRQWRMVERYMTDNYLAPVLSDSAKEAEGWFAGWMEACALDVAARWSKLIPPNAEQITALLLPALPEE